MRTLKLVVALLVIFTVSGLASAQEPPAPDIPGATIIATGLSAPQGILRDSDGNLWVVDSGMGGDQTFQIPGEDGNPMDVSMGMTARIVEIAPDGTQTDIATLPSIAAPSGEMLGGGRLALLDGVLYVTSGGWSGEMTSVPPDVLLGVVAKVDGSDVMPVAYTWDFEKVNNPDGLILDSHPYGLSAGPDGWLWVADAGSNDLLRVDPATGGIVTVAAFGGLPGAFPNPNRNGAVEADPVPTAVAFDDMGNAYVSLLSGAPFIPGSSKVVKVTAEGEVSDFATGLTMTTDIKRGPDGELYGVQFGMFTEEGPVPNAGSIVRIQEGSASTVLVSGLPFPTSIAFDDDGNAYVTLNGLGAPGSGVVARFDNVTGIEGEPLPTPQAQ